MKKLFSVLIAALFSATMFADTKIYCKVDQGWWTAKNDKGVAGAVAAHYWTTGGSVSTTWPGVRMTAVEGEQNIWSLDIDPTKADSIMFVRVPATGDLADWGAKTKGQKFPADDNTMFTITNSTPTWGDPGCDGTWSKFVPGQTPAPAKFYITGDAAALGSWNPAAIKSTEDSYTLNLAAGSYQLKVTLDGTWDEGKVKGFSDLSEKAEGLTEGKDNNICFTLAEAGSVKVTYTSSVFKLEGKFTAGGGGGVTPDPTPDPGTGDYYLKSNWGGSTEWTWKAMADAGEGKYKLENVVFGGSGVNYNTKADDDGAEWIAVDAFLGDKIGALDTVTLVLAPSASPVTVTATLLGKYVPTGDVKYYIKNNWDKAGDQWEWKEMTKDGEKYKIEKVIFGGLGVNYNTVAADAGATWVAVADFLGDKIVEKDSVTLVLDPKAGTITATLLAGGGGGETPDPQFDGKFYITGESLVGSWEPNALACENGEHTFTNLQAGDYKFKITVDGTWETAKGFSDLASRPKGVTEGDNNNICFSLTTAGNVKVSFNGSKISLEGAFDESKEVSIADGYYLIGQNGWSLSALDASLKFEANTGSDGEYKLDVTLTAGQELKVVSVENSTIKTWYPDGMGNGYTVDAAHAGAKTVYFRPAGNADWESFVDGGFFFIEASEQGIGNTSDGVKAVKAFENGTLVIIKNGVKYNAQGQVVR